MNTSPNPMVRICTILFMATFAVLGGSSFAFGEKESRDPKEEDFVSITTARHSKAIETLRKIDENWHPGSSALLIESARYLPNPRIEWDSETNQAKEKVDPTLAAIFELLEKKHDRDFGPDLRAWRRFLWQRPYAEHPRHYEYKAKLYGKIDPLISNFFRVRKSRTRLDEIAWGGVGVNGIPPLANPNLLEASEAKYLKDSHVVFGVYLNGEARAYPKRILAWHEMALDRIGGVDLTLVYCTLCGTVIPYGSYIGDRKFTFGTSGLLYRSNKLMFDEETGSLWSSLEGEPALGPLADSNLKLKAYPVVTTTWGEWRKAHPQTTVLSLDTGYKRNYGEGVAYRDYFATQRLMFEVPIRDRRLSNKSEILGLRSKDFEGEPQALALSARYLKRKPLYHFEFNGKHLLVVTSKKGANRVYKVGPNTFSSFDSANQTIRDSEGLTWSITEDALLPANPEVADSARLPRIPAFRSFWFAWYSQHPYTELIK